MASGVRGKFASLGRYARWWFDNAGHIRILIFVTCGVVCGLILLMRMIFWDGWENVAFTAAFVAIGWLHFAWDAIFWRLYWRLYLSRRRRPSTGRHTGPLEPPWEQ